jgi:hypothetical protein
MSSSLPTPEPSETSEEDEDEEGIHGKVLLRQPYLLINDDYDDDDDHRHHHHKNDGMLLVIKEMNVQCNIVVTLVPVPSSSHAHHEKVTSVGIHTSCEVLIWVITLVMAGGQLMLLTT